MIYLMQTKTAITYKCAAEISPVQEHSVTCQSTNLAVSEEAGYFCPFLGKEYNVPSAKLAKP